MNYCTSSGDGSFIVRAEKEGSKQLLNANRGGPVYREQGQHGISNEQNSEGGDFKMTSARAQVDQAAVK